MSRAVQTRRLKEHIASLETMTRFVLATLALGSGVYTDTYYANTAGVNYRTIVVDAAGNMTEQAFNQPAPFVCAYQLVR